VLPCDCEHTRERVVDPLKVWRKVIKEFEMNEERECVVYDGIVPGWKLAREIVDK